MVIQTLKFGAPDVDKKVDTTNLPAPSHNIKPILALGTSSDYKIYAHARLESPLYLMDQCRKYIAVITIKSKMYERPLSLKDFGHDFKLTGQKLKNDLLFVGSNHSWLLAMFDMGSDFNKLNERRTENRNEIYEEAIKEAEKKFKKEIKNEVVLGIQKQRKQISFEEVKFGNHY